MKKILISMMSLLFVITANAYTSSELNRIFKDGDLIFHESKTSQAAAIKEATGSQFTHVGIVYKSGTKWYVAEAVQPVKKTTLLTDFIKRGRNEDFVVRRLKNGMSKTQMAAVQKAISKYLGMNYDIYFEWSDKAIYCSEFTFKVFKAALGIEVGEVETWGELNTSGPYVQALIKKRLTDQGKPFNKDEKIVTPVGNYSSSYLMTAYDSNVGF